MAAPETWGLLTLVTIGMPRRKQEMMTRVLYTKDRILVLVNQAGYSSAKALNKHSTIENCKKKIYKTMS